MVNASDAALGLSAVSQKPPGADVIVVSNA
jgi:hypothetical protein